MSHHKKNDKHENKPGNHQGVTGTPAQETLSPWTVEPGKTPAAGAGQPQGAPSSEAAQAANAATGETASPAQLEELRKKAAERDEYLDLLQRTRADYLNYIKRAQKDRADAIKYGIQEFAERVVGVMDDFSRAIASAEKSKEFEKFFEGVKLIEARFQKVLAEAGITPIETAGKPFDPAMHEAIMQEESAEVPEGTILEQLERGFMLKDRVLRAAKVKVARRPAGQAAPADPPAGQSPKEGEK